MTAAAYCPTSGFDFESSGLLTTFKNLLPKGRNNVLDPDATISNTRRKYTFVTPTGDTLVLMFALDFQATVWLTEVMQSFSRLIGLKSDWDSYGARPIDLKSIVAALQVLLTLQPNTPIPELVPTPRGTIQLEWHIHGIDLEIDVLSRGLYHLAFEDFRSGEVIEDLVTSNLDDLNKPLRLLSNAPQSA